MAAALLALTLGAAAADYARSRAAWRRASPRLIRRLPAAFAIGVRREIHLSIELEGHAQLELRAARPRGPEPGARGAAAAARRCRRSARVTTSYAVVPTRRGTVDVRSRRDPPARRAGGWSSCSSGSACSETRRVYPDFAQVARYAWLAGDRRLQEIGIKSYQQRGQGTDFKQLAEYRIGDSVRHIDWRATLRLNRPDRARVPGRARPVRARARGLRPPHARRRSAAAHRHQPLRSGAQRRDAARLRGAEAGRRARRDDLRNAGRRGAVVPAAQGHAGAQRADGRALRRGADGHAFRLRRRRAERAARLSASARSSS